MVLLQVSVHDLYFTFIGMLILVLILIISVLFYSFKQYRTLILLSKWSTIIDDKILNAIVYEEDNRSDEKALSQLSHRHSFREYFLEKLVDSEKKFSGTASQKIKELFVDYDLQKESLKKLNQKKSFLIAGGIQELTAMRVETAVPQIASFLAHRCPQVYQEAQYSMVVFKGFEGLRFLNTATTKISDWQQLRLLLSVTHIPNNGPAEVERWLQSINESVIIFSLNLVRKFQMLSLYSSVWTLLGHGAVPVRIHAVQTLLSLEKSGTMTELAIIFETQPVKVQAEILKVMEISRDQRTVDFLKKQLQEHPATVIKIHAAEALHALGHADFLSAVKDQRSSTKELTAIIKHALQENI